MGPTNPPHDASAVAACPAQPGLVGADDAALAALRTQGAHLLDPARFRYIEVLARKAAEQPDPLRQHLGRLLAAAMAAYQAQFAQARADSEQALPGLIQRHPQAADAMRQLHGEADFRALRRLVTRLEAGRGTGPGPLGELVRHIDGQATALRLPDAGSHEAGAEARAATAPGPVATPVELRTLRHFRDTWTGLRVHRQMARSQEQAPENPGPLNSHLLVLRTLRRMQEIAPAYLEQFMAHAEALMWLDQARPRGLPATAKGGRPERDKRAPSTSKPMPSPTRARSA